MQPNNCRSFLVNLRLVPVMSEFSGYLTCVGGVSGPFWLGDRVFAVGLPCFVQLAGDSPLSSRSVPVLSDFNQKWNRLTSFSETLRYKISWKSIQRFLCY
jgi:hypothetical protein